MLGHASLMLGREEEALGHFMRALAARPTAVTAPCSPSISAYGLLGRAEEAQSLLRDLLARRPEVTVSNLRPKLVRSGRPTRSDNRHVGPARSRGLRLAGLPEE